MARALRAWAINRGGKNSVRNLRYGPQTRLVRGIYISYGLYAWRQGYKSNLNKILILQKRELHLMYFAKKDEHTIPMFITAKLLPLNISYYKTSSELMQDLSTVSVPINTRRLFTKTSSVHCYITHVLLLT